MTPEASLKSAIRDLCALRGWLRVPLLGGLGSMPGAPDMFVAIGELGWVAVECKAGKGKLSPAQREFAASCQRTGQRYLLARSVDDVLRYAAISCLPK